MLRQILSLSAFLWLSTAVAETQRVQDLAFERVLVYGSSELQIRQGDETELLLRGGDANREAPPFYLDGDTLVLGRSHKSGHSSGSVKFRLTVDKLTHILLLGSGAVYVKPLKLEDLHIGVEGAGNLKLFAVEAQDLTLRMSGTGDIQAAKLTVDELKLVLSGPGNIHIGKLSAKDAEITLRGSGDINLQRKGGVEDLEINMVGSGDVDAIEVEADTVEVNIMGSGTARVFAVSELDVNIMGSGDVFFRGNPEIEKSALGSGDLYPDPAARGREPGE